MNSNSKTNDLKQNWQDIKTKAKQQWNKLKNEDLDAIEGSYSQLVEKVGDAYELTKDEATKKVNDYLDKQGLSYLPEEAEAFKDKVAEKASETKDKLEEYLKDSCHKIKKYSEIIYADLETIETNGGGSARCMLAEVFLPKK